jgi:hypothetical protein
MPIDERVIHAALKEQKKSSESGRETAATIQVVPQRDEAEVHDASATARAMVASFRICLWMTD